MPVGNKRTEIFNYEELSGLLRQKVLKPLYRGFKLYDAFNNTVLKIIRVCSVYGAFRTSAIEKNP